jgi:integrase
VPLQPNDSSAKMFLDSVGRNSVKTKMAYAAGLMYFQLYLNTRKDKHTLQTIIKPLSTNKINVYELFDSFVGYLLNVISEETHHKLSKQSINLYIAAVRSYLAYHDIDLIPAKFKRKVRVPKIGREDELAIDAADIRKILLACNNRRVKTYLLILASSGCRTSEACSIRLSDIHFDTNPTTIHIRTEFTKTKTARDIYISNEASDYLKRWIAWKYRNHKQVPTDLIFIVKEDVVGSVQSLYNKLLLEFNKVLTVVGMDKRKENELRRKITLHSIRRFVKVTVADNVNSDYSEYILGHAHSSYYTKKELARRELYINKVMRHLTFLDYSLLETTGKGIEASLQEKDIRITTLEREMKELTDSHDILVQLYEADPQERRKLKALYRQAKENGTRIPGQMLFLKKEEYTPNSFSYQNYENDIRDQEEKIKERKRNPTA